MEKPFLLIAGDYYYPAGGTGDWFGFYETYEEAELASKQFDRKIPFDWMEIVDIRDWQPSHTKLDLYND